MRISGILLHPTSLPGGHGIGDLGPWAFRFADFLSESGQGLWQVLPLAPPAEANSPYKAYSSMAGNPLLISLDLLAGDGMLARADLAEAPSFSGEAVEYDAVAAFKWNLLRKATRAFFEDASAEHRHRFEQFCVQQRFWLEQFAVFAALRDQNGGSPWTTWVPQQIPDPEDVRLHKYIQFEFFRQWQALKKYCHERGIHMVGDLPIFVAHDSADVWGNPGLFNLDERGWPRTVAGVPPDYFSATGQLWGNPLYRWDVMERTGYQWWIDRMRCMLEQFDVVRIDHFRGFEQYFEIPADAKTAALGHWVDGPRDRFFEALTGAFGKLPFFAEDLGMITPEVLALRDRWGFPGMRILQFAFLNDWHEDPFKPHNFIPNCVVYTGTHDNDTTLGWFRATGEDTLTAEQRLAERERALRYLNSDGKEIHWDFIRAAVCSKADTAIFPLQDALGLGSEARMNVPSRAENNWRWRFLPQQLTPQISARLLELSCAGGRLQY
jgi:4-alpha-glucanotransferase